MSLGLVKKIIKKNIRVKLFKRSLNVEESLLITAMSAIFLFSSYQIFHTRYDIEIPYSNSYCIKAWRVGVIDKWDKTVKRNNVYVFRSKHMILRPDGLLIAKYFKGLPFDKVEVNNDEAVLINDNVIGQGLYHSTKIPNMNFKRKEYLGFDEYWGMGSKGIYQSFDSRYWGKIDEKQIVGRFICLF